MGITTDCKPTLTPFIMFFIIESNCMVLEKCVCIINLILTFICRFALNILIWEFMLEYNQENYMTSQKMVGLRRCAICLNIENVGTWAGIGS